MVHTFLKSISPKVNIIESQEFKLGNYDVTVKYISHYAIGTPTTLVQKLELEFLIRHTG